MYKRINIVFILFSIMVVVSIFLLMLLRVEKYSKSILLNNENQSYILIKQTDYAEISNQNEIKFKLDDQIFNAKNVETTYFENYSCILIYDYFYLPNQISPISVYLKSKNILGF